MPSLLYRPVDHLPASASQLATTCGSPSCSSHPWTSLPKPTNKSQALHHLPAPVFHHTLGSSFCSTNFITSPVPVNHHKFCSHGSFSCSSCTCGSCSCFSKSTHKLCTCTSPSCSSHAQSWLTSYKLFITLLLQPKFHHTHGSTFCSIVLINLFRSAPFMVHMLALCC